jgi:acid phosphatase family membrane protein YuiD
MYYNYVITSAVISWAAAQILKFLLSILTKKKLSFERLIGSGGMPSSHSSAVIGGLTAVGIKDGIGSTSFAILFILSVVVVYDAMNVRYEAGVHAKELNKFNRMLQEFPEFLEKLKKPSQNVKVLKEYLGHTPYEVFAGILIGIITPFSVPMSF